MKSVGGEMLRAYKMRNKDGSTGTVYIGGDGLPHRFQGSEPNSTVTLSKFNAVPPIRPPM